MRLLSLFLLLFCNSFVLAESTEATEHASFEQTPYQEPKVMFEFYFDDPNKINSALYWLRSYINPLTDEPYNYAPELMEIGRAHV